MRNIVTFRILGSLLAFAATVGLSLTAYATSGTNTLSDITLEGTQFARIALAGSAIGGRPACHNAAYIVHYGFDLSTAKGKALLATAQAAQLSGKRVTATGDGTCTNIGAVTIETLQSLTIFTN